MDCAKYTEKFVEEFSEKTQRGREEHGDKEIWDIDGISESLDEVKDLWAYVCVEEEKRELTKTEVIWLRKFFEMFECDLSLLGFGQEMYEVEKSLYRLERYFGLETQQYDLELEDGTEGF